MSGYHDGSNTFYLGEVDWDMEGDMIVPLHRAISEQSKLAHGLGRIDMFINSYGGLAHVAFHIVEMMELAKAEGIIVRTVVTSNAYSAGSIIAVAGTPGFRYIAKNAQHLVHYGSTGSRNKSPEQATRNHKATHDFFKQISDHYKHYCDIPDLEEYLKTDDWFINSAKAKKWKMADNFLDKFVVV